MKEETPGDVYILLDNVRSIHNVGSIFRTAACAGVEEIILCGYTPEPVDRFGRARKDFAKVSLGGEKEVSYRKFKTTEEGVEYLKQKGVSVVSVEQSKKAVSFRDFEPMYPVGYVFGNEVDGVSEDILEKSDTIVEIPLRGNAKESLNVSVTVGIILFDK